jgi:hypothetical protein
LRSCPQANVETPRPPEVPKASTCAAPKGRANTAYHRVGENIYAPLLGPPQLPGHATPTRRALHIPSIPVVCSRGLDPELGSPTPKASKRPGSKLESPTPKVRARDEPPAPTTGERLPGVADPWDHLRGAESFCAIQNKDRLNQSASTQRSNPEVRIAPPFPGQGSNLSPEGLMPLSHFGR